MTRAPLPLCLAFLAAALLPAVAGGAEPAEVVLRNGKIYTVDPARSIRQALAFTGNTIVAVGSDAEVAPLVGPRTTVVDLQGRLVLPGLIDAHVHPVLGAINAAKCSLAGVPATIEALRPALRACLDARPGGPDDWLEAVQLDNYGFSATAADLDAIEAVRPVALYGNDGHTLWTNGRGLEVAEITAATPDPEGGRIDRDATGKPTGFLADTATNLVYERIPLPPLDLRADYTAAELRSMAASGITSLADVYVSPPEAEVWRLLHDTGRLTMRVRASIYVEDLADSGDAAVARIVATSRAMDVDPDFLRSGSVKFFADGVMEAPTQTAALLEPYLDQAGHPTDERGELYFEPELFARLVTRLDAAGLNIHVHAIGDRAVRATLDAFAAARSANGANDNRHQIAHLQLVDPADFPRFAELGVMANMQLDWAKRDSSNEGPVEPFLGPGRYRYLYPAGSLLAAGATIVGGSDWDVSTYHPFVAMQHGVTRVERGSGRPPLNLDERIPIATAVDAYTINAAVALKQEGTTGSLEVGKRADLIILDRDILTVDPATIQDTVVLATWLDGRLVHGAPP